MVDRLVRNRGSVGRRIWRRRRRRAHPAESAGAAPGAAGTAGPGEAESWEDVEEDEEDEALDDIDEEPPFLPPVPPRPKSGATTQAATGTAGGATSGKKGFFASLLGAFSRDKTTPPPADPPWLVVDPTRLVLAVPRGAARLDAFEQAIQTTTAGTAQFHALALAFHKELQFLAENASVDLSLFESRVEACARALIAAGEEERAGTLFLRVGRRHQAAELFLAAGAVDALEEAHAQIQWDEGGVKHEARLSFERFEALFLVGMREPALLCLERAHRLWHDNPIYAEIFRTFTERLGTPHRLALTAGKQELVVVGTWPVVIGRGEDAGVRLTSPLVSRAHLQVELEGGRPVLVDLDSRGGTRLGAGGERRELTGRQPLPPGADIDMAGLVVHTRVAGGALWLWPALAPEQRTVAAMTSTVMVPAPRSLPATSVEPSEPGAPGEPALKVRFDARGRAVLEQPALLHGEPLRRATLLLEGDKIAAVAGGPTWTVARRS